MKMVLNVKFELVPTSRRQSLYTHAFTTCWSAPNGLYQKRDKNEHNKILIIPTVCSGLVGCAHICTIYFSYVYQ